jgi:hypothetical protein
MTRNGSGKGLEHRVLRRVRGTSTYAMQSLGSRGTWDIVAITPDKIRVIQCKSRGYLQFDEKNQIVSELQRMPDNVQAELVYRISPKKTKTKILKAVGPIDFDKLWMNLSYFDKPKGISLCEVNEDGGKLSAGIALTL